MEDKSAHLIIKKGHLLAIGGLIVLVTGVAIYYLYQSNQSTQALITTQQQEIKIIADTASSSIAAAQQEATHAQADAAVAKAEATRAASSNNSIDLSALIKHWQPIVGYIVCSFQYTDGTTYLTQSGSGSLIIYSDGTGKRALLTNKHVVTDANGYGPAQCLIKFPDDATIFHSTLSDISLATDGADKAYAFIDDPDTYLVNMTTEGRNYCKATPDIGASIVILGYPSVGSPTGITATEGIVSGYDGDYLITSAKVEHGNSGGAAIDEKNNCYLGIPTYAVSGTVESLARILKWQAF